MIESSTICQPADVLVGDRLREDLALADGLLLHLDDRVVHDLDDALRHDLDDHERKCAAHEGDPRHDDDVALRDRPLQEAALHEVLDPLTEGDLVPLADDRRDRDALRGQDLRLAHLDLVHDRDAEVPADEAVDADDALALVLLHHAKQLGGGPLLADDLDDLADVDAERESRFRVDARAPETDVGLRRFRHFENDPFGHERFNRVALFQRYRLNA